MYDHEPLPRTGQPDLWYALDDLRRDHSRLIQTTPEASYHRQAAFALMLVAADTYQIEPFKESL